MSNTKQIIKFNTFNVRNTQTGKSARVHYSLDNRTDGRKCVTIYDRDYGHALAGMFGESVYKNDTDSMTDYFDKGTVRLFENHPLYAAAREFVETTMAAYNAKRAAKWAAKVRAAKPRVRIVEGKFVRAQIAA
jgi:hypothetical protein